MYFNPFCLSLYVGKIFGRVYMSESEDQIYFLFDLLVLGYKR